MFPVRAPVEEEHVETDIVLIMHSKQTVALQYNEQSTILASCR